MNESLFELQKKGKEELIIIIQRLRHLTRSNKVVKDFVVVPIKLTGNTHHISIPLKYVLKRGLKYGESYKVFIEEIL